MAPRHRAAGVLRQVSCQQTKEHAPSRITVGTAPNWNLSSSAVVLAGQNKWQQLSTDEDGQQGREHRRGRQEPQAAHAHESQTKDEQNDHDDRKQERAVRVRDIARRQAWPGLVVESEETPVHK